LEVELKNIILVAFRFFEFLHRVKNGSRGLAAGCLLCSHASAALGARDVTSGDLAFVGGEGC
jgi:hypothetical protein